MRVHHHTGTATIVQFTLGVLLTFISGANSIAGGCYGVSGADCVTNAFVSLLLVLLVVAGYGTLVAVGYIAWLRRSPKLALVLIALEAGASVIFLFDAKQSLNLVDRLINLCAFAVALWVAYVAYNLFRAGGARVVRNHQS